MSDMQFGLPDQVIERMCKVFAQYSKIDQVILYGSRAKGNQKPGSDIDLTLIGEDLNLGVQFKIENDLDDLLLPWMIDLSIYSHIKNKDLLEHIAQIGKPFSATSIKPNT